MKGGGDGGVSEICLRVQSYYFGKFLNPRTTPSDGGEEKFTPEYIIVGGEGEVSEICLRVQSYYFGN